MAIEFIQIPVLSGAFTDLPKREFPEPPNLLHDGRVSGVIDQVDGLVVPGRPQRLGIFQFRLDSLSGFGMGNGFLCAEYTALTLADSVDVFFDHPDLGMEGEFWPL